MTKNASSLILIMGMCCLPYKGKQFFLKVFQRGIDIYPCMWYNLITVEEAVENGGGWACSGVVEDLIYIKHNEKIFEKIAFYT